MFPKEKSARELFFERLDELIALNKKRDRRKLAQIIESAGLDPKALPHYFNADYELRMVPQPDKLDRLLKELAIVGAGKPDIALLVDQLEDAAALARRERASPRASSKTGASPASPKPGPSPAPNIDIRAIAAFALPTLVGRHSEYKLLQEAWASALDEKPTRTRILVLHASGGEGKTSLISRWASDVAASTTQAVAIFAWSFYNQGTGDQARSTSDEFVNAALKHFGLGFDESTASTPMVRARRLVDHLQQTTTLLLLDGLEPLQFSPGPSVDATLKDDAIRHLLVSLRRRNPGLCVVTTRLNISELNEGEDVSARQVVLPPLSISESLQLLRSMTWGFGDGAYRLRGEDDEFIDLAEWTRGHALTLSLAGKILIVAHQGDLRVRDQITLHGADSKIPFASGRTNHAWRVLESYETWFERGAEDGLRCLALLRALSLFDRPAPVDCLLAVFQGPPIDGFTNALGDQSSVQIDITFKQLESFGLATGQRAGEFGMTLEAVDTHPLIREFFAAECKQTRLGAWREAHGRLFAFYADKTANTVPRAPSDLEPLYLAVVHGCSAGYPQRAFDEIFWSRICRGHAHFSTSKFGAVNRDLAALASFFATVWSAPSELLTADTQATVCSLAAFRLRSMGRFGEAKPLMDRALDHFQQKRAWAAAANEAGNLSVLLMHAGRLAEALAAADRSLAFAKAREHDEGASAKTQLFISGRHAVRADALFQLGLEGGETARQEFELAETVQAEHLPDRPLLYSTKGYRYHELLLDLGQAEEVLRRTEIISAWKTEDYEILDQGLISLVQARAHLLLGQRGDTRELKRAKVQIQHALDHFFLANYQESYVRALVVQVEIEAALDRRSELIKDSLDRAWELASRGPLALFQADILLARVRTDLDQDFARNGARYPWRSVDDDLTQAQRLIDEAAYGRRREELARLLRRREPAPHLNGQLNSHPAR